MLLVLFNLTPQRGILFFLPQNEEAWIPGVTISGHFDSVQVNTSLLQLQSTVLFRVAYIAKHYSIIYIAVTALPL